MIDRQNPHPRQGSSLEKSVQKRRAGWNWLTIAFLALVLAQVAPVQGEIPAIVRADEERVLESLNAWLAHQNSPMAGNISLFLDSHEGNTLRVRIIPANPNLGPVMDGYLRFQTGTEASTEPGQLQGNWEVLAVREIYPEALYNKLEIPESLRDPVQELHFQAPSAEIVEELRKMVSEALQIRLSTPVESAYQNVYTQNCGLSARFTFQMQGPVIPEPRAAFEMVRRELTTQGWEPVPDYLTGGERGVMGAFYKGNIQLHLRIGWVPAADWVEPANELLVIDVPLDQRVYHLLADVIEFPGSADSEKSEN